jgi:3-hydroxymyristoyl/3-hydroxydecanoyl-(acyl carrier protein) dehydratase
MNTVRWTVPADHPAFAGHFPGRPIVPGVVLLDKLVQAVTASSTGRVAGIASAKFLSPAGPGAVLDFSWAAGAGRALRFDIACAGAAVATGTLMLAD